MAASIVQSNKGQQNTGLATVTATLASGATAGNTIVLVFAADDYNGTPNAGWTQSTDCEQQTFLGHYLWWQVASGGETSFQYTIGSASPSCWIIFEISGLTGTPYVTSNGQFAQSSGTSYTTPSITPSAGERFLVGTIGGSSGGAGLTSMGSWTNSFTEVADQWTVLGSGTRDSCGVASLPVTADGSTAYSTGATWDSGGTAQARTGIIIAFDVSAGGGSEVDGTGAGSYAFTAAGSGVPVVLGAAAGAYAFTGTAAGDDIPPVDGSGAGAYSFAGTGQGTPTAVGLAAAAPGFTGTALGVRGTGGLASSAPVFGSSASGLVTVPGAAAAAFGFAASASGEVAGRIDGTGAGSYVFAAAASGVPVVVGAASFAAGFAGAASGSGVSPVEGSGLAAYTFTAAAAGVRAVPGQAAAAYAFAASATVPDATGTGLELLVGPPSGVWGASKPIRGWPVGPPHT